jgi:hypothetical protein
MVKDKKMTKYRFTPKGILCNVLIDLLCPNLKFHLAKPTKEELDRLWVTYLNLQIK